MDGDARFILRTLSKERAELTVIEDQRGHLRHFQICALSAASSSQPQVLYVPVRVTNPPEANPFTDLI